MPLRSPSESRPCTWKPCVLGGRERGRRPHLAPERRADVFARERLPRLPPRRPSAVIQCGSVYGYLFFLNASLGKLHGIRNSGFDVPVGCLHISLSHAADAVSPWTTRLARVSREATPHTGGHSLDLPVHQT